MLSLAVLGAILGAGTGSPRLAFGQGLAQGIRQSHGQAPPQDLQLDYNGLNSLDSAAFETSNDNDELSGNGKSDKEYAIGPNGPNGPTVRDRISARRMKNKAHRKKS